MIQDFIGGEVSSDTKPMRDSKTPGFGEDDPGEKKSFLKKTGEKFLEAKGKGASLMSFLQSGKEDTRGTPFFRCS
jgi:hypothetical protein